MKALWKKMKIYRGWDTQKQYRKSKERRKNSGQKINFASDEGLVRPVQSQLRMSSLNSSASDSEGIERTKVVVGRPTRTGESDSSRRRARGAELVRRLRPLRQCGTQGLFADRRPCVCILSRGELHRQETASESFALVSVRQFNLPRCARACIEGLGGDARDVRYRRFRDAVGIPVALESFTVCMTSPCADVGDIPWLRVRVVRHVALKLGR